MTIAETAKQAKAAAIKMAALKPQTKNYALAAVADALRANAEAIVTENRRDLDRAQKDNLAAPLLKRLKFDRAKLEGVCEGIESLIKLDDPVGKTLAATELDAGLELYKVSCPIGLIGVIFESRPDALVQISSLCLKSANAVMLKGGSEAAATNRILSQVIAQASEKAGLPDGWLANLETRADVKEMLGLDQYIDLIVPRGSNEFIQYIMNNTHITVIGHADGICHVYIDADADADTALAVAVDSKCQYVAVCNAMETLLVHTSRAKELLPRLKEAYESKGVEIRGCEKTRAVIAAAPASEQDWRTEYLDNIVSIRTVESMAQAVDHINTFGSHHTDAIVTRDMAHAAEFMNLVDSADVFVNCSTRFSDGFRFGLGAEVGISTGKIHARGPVGLEGLLSYKWKLVGSGQIVADYAAGEKKFTHKSLHKDCPL